MTLSYANPALKTTAGRSMLRLATIVVGLLLFATSATLCVKAIRWDRWSTYEETHPRWHERGPLGIERYSSFKAWQFWRACWTRGLAASIISFCTIAAAVAVAMATWKRAGFSWWLLLIVILHATVIVYFAMRWGPEFRPPSSHWTG
jgi:hypothetical protein